MVAPSLHHRANRVGGRTRSFKASKSHNSVISVNTIRAAARRASTEEIRMETPRERCPAIADRRSPSAATPSRAPVRTPASDSSSRARVIKSLDFRIIVGDHDDVARIFIF